MLTKLLGIPEEDSEKLFHWADAAVYHSDPDFTDLIYDRDDTDPYRLLQRCILKFSKDMFGDFARSASRTKKDLVDPSAIYHKPT